MRGFRRFGLGVLVVLTACAGGAGGSDTGLALDATPDAPYDVAVSTGPLRGRVVRQGSLTPLPEARVTLLSVDSSSFPGMGPLVTGPDGGFVFDDVPEGEYRLDVSRVGHRDATKTVTRVDGREERIEVALGPLVADGEACLNCHADVNALLASLAADPPPPPTEAPEGLGECCGGSVPDRPVHEKVLITMDFAQDVHFELRACQDCHAGDPSATTRALAHVGLVSDPTADGGGACRSCHGQVVARAQASGHFTLSGKRRAVAIRAGVTGDLPEPLATGFDRHCNRCHATCGDCHVSVPQEAGSGLLKGHAFVRTPPDHLTCVGCHGTRVRDEYQGRNAGPPADIHFEVGRMTCPDCHTGDQMHGPVSGNPNDLAARSALAPRCDACHTDDAAFRAVPAHREHRDSEDRLTLSCQTCHAAEYKHCYACHVSLDADGAPTHVSNAATNYVSPLAFRIGRNAEVDAMHPEAWVTVRHVPATPEAFLFYGDGLLPAFDAAPTWRRAAPHTIRRTTARTDPPDGCATGCHGVRGVFLGPDDLPPDEILANAPVVVTELPGPAVP